MSNSDLVCPCHACQAEENEALIAQFQESFLHFVGLVTFALFTMIAQKMIVRSASRLAVTRSLSRSVVAIPWADFSSRRFSAAPQRQDTTENDEKKVAAEPLTANKNGRKELEDLPVTFSDISRANVAIRGGVKRTACTKSYFLSELIGANIYIKPEFQQFTGSFKERGARNAILQLMRDNKSGSKLNGVIAASAGNHALALAYHGNQLGVPVTVVMPVVAPLAKVDKCRVSIIFDCV